MLHTTREVCAYLVWTGLAASLLPCKEQGLNTPAIRCYILSREDLCRCMRHR